MAIQKGIIKEIAEGVGYLVKDTVGSISGAIDAKVDREEKKAQGAFDREEQHRQNTYDIAAGSVNTAVTSVYSLTQSFDNVISGIDLLRAGKDRAQKTEYAHQEEMERIRAELVKDENNLKQMLEDRRLTHKKTVKELDQTHEEKMKLLELAHEEKMKQLDDVSAIISHDRECCFALLQLIHDGLGSDDQIRTLTGSISNLVNGMNSIASGILAGNDVLALPEA